MKANKIQERITDLFGNSVVAFTKDDDRLFQYSEHDVPDIFWIHTRRDGKYFEMGLPVALLELENTNWTEGIKLNLDVMFSKIRK